MGNIPKPERWRDIPNEVREQDLERIRDEELGDPEDLVRRVEDENRRLTSRELVDRLLANARERNRYRARYAKPRKLRRTELRKRKPRATHWAALLLDYVRRSGEVVDGQEVAA